MAPRAHRAAHASCLIAKPTRRHGALWIIEQGSEDGVRDPFQNYAVVGTHPN